MKIDLEIRTVILLCFFIIIIIVYLYRSTQVLYNFTGLNSMDIRNKAASNANLTKVKCGYLPKNVCSTMILIANLKEFLDFCCNENLSVEKRTIVNPSELPLSSFLRAVIILFLVLFNLLIVAFCNNTLSLNTLHYYHLSVYYQSYTSQDSGLFIISHFAVEIKNKRVVINEILICIPSISRACLSWMLPEPLWPQKLS